jgi:iron-sulfur cluster repair protein YtfE (RIC family)
MNAEATRLMLLAQHDRLRMQIQICTRLARLYNLRQTAGTELDLALELLREDFALHNESETREIRRLLQGPSEWSTLLIDRMMEEHVAEHAAFWEMLSGTRAEVAARIDDLADELDAHMAAEERTILAPVTLRDDIIRVRTREAPAK